MYLEGGNTRLVEALASGLPIEYGKAVHTVRYGQGGGRGAAAVEVGTEDGGVVRNGISHVFMTQLCPHTSLFPSVMRLKCHSS